MDNNATRACWSCGNTIAGDTFTCQHCDAPQPVAPPVYMTKQNTRIAQGAGGLPAVIAATPSPARTLQPASLFRRGPFMVGVVTFAGSATKALPLTPVREITDLDLKLGFSGTNGEDAFFKAEELLFGDSLRVYSKIAIVMMSDGRMTQRNGVLGVFGIKATEAALKKARELHAKARVACVFFDAGDRDEATLRHMASAASLFQTAGRGELISAMVSMTKLATRTATSIQNPNALPGTAIVFCLDVSPSMGQGEKLAELHAAFMQCIRELSALESQ